MLKIHQKIKNAKPATLSSPQPLQIKKGETTLTLTDVKTGEVQVYHDTNMQTNALNEMLRNCGWLNRDNWDQNNLITQLLGGVLLFDTAITEDANIVMPPAGLTMTANCSIDATTTQAGDPTELGTYRPDESGLQGDNSYLLTYDWATAQGNGVIACICATNRQFGYGGDGNFHSGVSKSSLITNNLQGSYTRYGIKGIPCKINLDDSSCYAVDFSQRSEGKVIIRKYRLPISKVNLLGTVNSPHILSEVTLSGDDVPSQLITELNRSGYESAPRVYDGTINDTGETLVITNQPQNGNAIWGTNFTQKLWEIDPVNATITESTLTNTSGDELHGMMSQVWLNKDCVAWVDGWGGYGYSAVVDGRTVYSMKRESGVWSTIQKCTNPLGYRHAESDFECGFDYPQQYSDNKVYMSCRNGNNVVIVFDYDLNRITRTNQRPNTTSNQRLFRTNKPFINYYTDGRTDNSNSMFDVFRTQYAIATINNLSTSVVKDSSKMMKLQYRFTFEEEPEEENS